MSDTTLDVAAAFTEAARSMEGPLDLDETLQAIVRVARDAMPGIDHVGISWAYRDGQLETRAATDDLVAQLDRLQYELGEGPCLHAMDADSTVRVEDARHEQRWPRFIAAAVGLGLRSQLGLPLHLDATSRVGLNLYSTSSDHLTAEAEHLAELFAAHASLALGHAYQVENLNQALASRKLIGLALGMVMERFGVGEDAAFAFLTRVSSTTQTKLRDVAARVVDEHCTRHGLDPVPTHPEPAESS